MADPRRDIPIIFSGPMVRALLDGRKTMTRRLAWRIPRLCPDFPGKPSPWAKVKPGDRLWVRENLCAMGNWGLWHDAGPVPASGKFLDDIDERGRAILERYAPTEATDSARVPSIHMPRWASRLTLIVTATKIERLQDISKADCIAEGMADLQDVHAGWHQSFAQLWDRLHGDGAWAENPEVVALTFAVHNGNIDTLPAAPTPPQGDGA